MKLTYFLCFLFDLKNNENSLVHRLQTNIIMADRDESPVPITTLAGLASLSDCKYNCISFLFGISNNINGPLCYSALRTSNIRFI